MLAVGMDGLEVLESEAIDAVIRQVKRYNSKLEQSLIR
jgi:hypothetical protein